MPRLLYPHALTFRSTQQYLPCNCCQSNRTGAHEMEEVSLLFLDIAWCRFFFIYFLIRPTCADPSVFASSLKTGVRIIVRIAFLYHLPVHDASVFVLQQCPSQILFKISLRAWTAFRALESVGWTYIQVTGTCRTSQSMLTRILQDYFGVTRVSPSRGKY